MELIQKIKKVIRDNKDYIGHIIDLLALLATVRIGITANSIAAYQKNVSVKQTSILEQQTQILEKQTQIQNASFIFEKDKNRTDSAKQYREKMNTLFDDINGKDSSLSKIHKKLKTGGIIFKEEQDELNKYIDSFEDIGGLYCDGFIKIADLKLVLKESLKPMCTNTYIADYYKNTKSGVAGICKELFPSGDGIVTYADSNKCPQLLK